MFGPREVMNEEIEDFVLLRSPKEGQAEGAPTYQLSVVVDARSVTDTISNILPLGREYDLSAYDLAYVDVAVRHELPLATLDAALQTAARAAGIKRCWCSRKGYLGRGYVVPTRVSRPVHSRSRRANFWTLPVEVFGSGPNSIASGHL